MWERIVTFFKEYDVHKLTEALQNLNWMEVLKSPFFWLGAVLFGAWIVWKKQYKLLLLPFSFVAFSYLFRYSLPTSGQEVGLEQLLKFLGGAIVIVGVNIYFFFIHED